MANISVSKRFVLILLLFVAFFVLSKPVSALQRYVSYFIDDVRKYCDKDPKGDKCHTYCGYLGGTDDKWDVALTEKNRCIELTCTDDDDKTERRKNGLGQKVEVYTPCGILCENIGDRHPLCAQDKIEKYCTGNGKDSEKCNKYCERSGNKSRLCPNGVVTPVSASNASIQTKLLEPSKVITVTEERGKLEENTNESAQKIVETVTPEIDVTNQLNDGSGFIQVFMNWWRGLWKW